MITLYGIANCDTCRKARKWLTAEGISHAYHDLRKDGLSAQTLEVWVASLGWEGLINRRGTTWRKLTDDEKSGFLEPATTDESRMALVLQNTTLIKRPVLDLDGRIVVGFGESERDAISAQGLTA